MKLLIFPWLCLTIYDFFYFIVEEINVKNKSTRNVIIFVIKIIFDLLFGWIFSRMYSSVRTNEEDGVLSALCNYWYVYTIGMLIYIGFHIQTRKPFFWYFLGGSILFSVVFAYAANKYKEHIKEIVDTGVDKDIIT